MPVITLKDGARLNYSETGSGVPLILIHGSPGENRAWGRVIKHFSATRRVLAPDLPGYGGSDPLSPAAVRRTEAMAAALGQLIEYCGGPVLLCGHSYGGNVALHAALRYQERVKGLFLVEPVFMRALELAGEQTTRADTEAFFTTYLMRVEFAEPDAIGLMIDFWSGAGTYARLPPRQKRFLNEATPKNAEDVPASFAETITAEQLASLNRPVMIAYGGASPPVAGAICKALAGLLPQAELVRIDGAAHGMLDTHPQEVAGYCDRFCENHARAM